MDTGHSSLANEHLCSGARSLSIPIRITGNLNKAAKHPNGTQLAETV